MNATHTIDSYVRSPHYIDYNLITGIFYVSSAFELRGDGQFNLMLCGIDVTPYLTWQGKLWNRHANNSSR